MPVLIRIAFSLERAPHHRLAPSPEDAARRQHRRAIHQYQPFHRQRIIILIRIRRPVQAAAVDSRMTAMAADRRVTVAVATVGPIRGRSGTTRVARMGRLLRAQEP